MYIVDIKLWVMLFDYPFLHVHFNWFPKAFLHLEYFYYKLLFCPSEGLTGAHLALQ